jgi:hypothetical protein
MWRRRTAEWINGDAPCLTACAKVQPGDKGLARQYRWMYYDFSPPSRRGTPSPPTAQNTDGGFNARRENHPFAGACTS